VDTAINNDYEVRPPSKKTGDTPTSNGGDYEVRAPDFTTSKISGEKTYRMGTGGKFVGVPYSRVRDATDAGWMISPEDLPKYFEAASLDRTMRRNMVVPKTAIATSFTKPGAEKYAGAPTTPYREMAPFQSAGKNLDELFQASTARREMNPNTKPTAPTLHANIDAAWNAAGNTLKVPLNIANRAARMVWGLGAVPAQIYDTAKGLFSADDTTANNAWESFVGMNPGVQLYDRTKEFVDEWKQSPQQAIENSIGDLVGIWMAGRATEKLGTAGEKKAKPGAVKPKFEGLRTGIRRPLGIEEHTEKQIEQFGKESEAVRGKNKVEAEKNRQAEIGAHEKNREAAQEHQTARDKAREHNMEVLRDRRKRVEATQDLETASQRLQRRIEAAQKQAKAADDAAWSAWRKKVGTAETDPTPIVETIDKMRNMMDLEDVAEFRRVIKEAAPEASDADIKLRDDVVRGQGGTTWEKMTDQQKSGVNTVLKSLGIDPDTIEKASQVSAPRLHVWKTQLEYAVRKASRGNVRYAIGQVLDAVRSTEEQLSTAAGADKELKQARALHGPYMDTFRNSPNTPTTVASAVRSKVTPEFTKDTALVKQIAMLARYDATIPNLVDHIGSLQDALRALPKEAPLRTQLKQNPPPLGPPEKAKVKPLTPPPEVPNLRAESVKFIRSKLRRYGSISAGLARLAIGSGTIALAHGHLSTGLGTELILGQGAVSLLTKALSSERALNWLAKPSAEDMKLIDALPPEDADRLRTSLNMMADHERRTDPAARKIKIAPEMVKFLAGKAAAPVTVAGASQQELKREADQRKPAQPISVAAPDGSVHVFQNQAAADQFKAAAGIQ
jgi:hypothetical protein